MIDGTTMASVWGQGTAEVVVGSGSIAAIADGSGVEEF